MQDQEIFDAYDGIRLDLPDGKRITCRPLKVREGVRFLRMLMDARGGDPAAHLAVLDEFPAAVGIEDEELTPAEVFEVLDRFLAHRRTPEAGRATESASAAPTPASGSVGPT